MADVERSLLLECANWTENDVIDIVNQKWKTGLSNITTVQYALLYIAVCEKYPLSVYAKMENILRSVNPAFETPKKWANITRTVLNNMKRKQRFTEGVFNISGIKANDYIGPICECLGIKKSTLNENLLSPSTILTVDAFHELCLYKAREKYCWHDVSKWLKNFIPKDMKINPDKVRFLHNNVCKTYQLLMKNRKKDDLEYFKDTKFFKFVNSKSTVAGKQSSEERSKIKRLSTVCKNLISSERQVLQENNNLAVENKILAETVRSSNQKLHKIENEFSKQTLQIEKLQPLKGKVKHLRQENKNLHQRVTSLKQENYAKRLKRKEKKLFEKENDFCKQIKTLQGEKNELLGQMKKSEEAVKQVTRSHRIKVHKYSNRLSYMSKSKNEIVNKLQECQVSLENMKQDNITLKKEMNKISEENRFLSHENRYMETKEPNTRRYSDDLRSCIMELHGIDVPSNKVSNVIRSVSDNLFHTDIDLPSRTTVQNICDEAHVIAKHHVSEVLAEADNFDIFSDGTGRDGKKILDIGVHTSKSSLSLGYKSMAKEDSETVADVIKNSLIEAAEIQNVNINKLLSSLSAMMSDRSSVMKKTNQILDEWRTAQLENEPNECEKDKLNFFYCSAHVLLGFHSQIVKCLTNYGKNADPIGRDTLSKFWSFRNSTEPPAVRLIRTASEILGPRGDEKNGARQQWLAYLSSKRKSSKIINYRGNRFNNLFTGAVSIIHHKHDITDFLKNYFENPNLKLQSVLADISSEKVMSQVAAIAVASVNIAEPYWDLINSDEHYLDLYKFVIPLYNKLKQWKDDCDDLLDGSMQPLFEKYPHVSNHSIIDSAKHFSDVKQFIKIICEAMFDVVGRQLSDHLPSGIYSTPPSEHLRKITSQSKLTNIDAENLFGDFDFSMKKKPNATLRHISSVTMFKRNHTSVWLKKKSVSSKKCLMKKARKNAKFLKNKEIAYEKTVLDQRKQMITDIKRKKIAAQRKKTLELNQIERSVRSMGGVVRSRDDIDSILRTAKTMKLKKERLRFQLLYCQKFLDLPIATKEFARTNTIIKLKNNLVRYLKLDEPKILEVGTFVAVSYEDDWYPGEILSLKEESLSVKFMCRNKKGGTTFTWPERDDIQTIDKKFVLFSHFDVLPSPGLRYWILPDFDEITEKHNEYVQKYFN